MAKENERRSVTYKALDLRNAPAVYDGNIRLVILTYHARPDRSTGIFGAGGAEGAGGVVGLGGVRGGGRLSS